ncbi:MAG: hypothetical protein VCB42_03205, partial [Myxococcota bacterium]
MSEPFSHPAAAQKTAPGTPSPAGQEAHPGPRGISLSAMVPRFNFIFRWFARRFFGHFELAPEMVEGLRELESRGSV